MKELTAKQVRDAQPTDKHQRIPAGGVSGLHLVISPTGAKKWIVRVVVKGSRTDLGIGGYPSVSLSDARAKARELKLKIKDGFDPQADKRKRLKQVEAERVKAITFYELAESYHANVIQHELNNLKSINQWINTIRTYANPVIGSKRIEDITENHIIKILQPIWFTKSETASRLRQRIVKVMNYGIRKQKLNIRNVAEWASIDGELPKAKTVIKKQLKHHSALPVEKLPAFMESLRHRTELSARLLEFIILNACRFGEASAAKWSDIDIRHKLMTIPAERMKAGKDHIIPLTDASIKLLSNLPRSHDNDHVFQPPRAPKFSDMATTNLIKKMNDEDGGLWIGEDGRRVVTHGFRSTFKEWARRPQMYHHNAFDDEVSELQLAHVNNDTTRSAYARGSLVDERREMLNEWVSFCTGMIKLDVIDMTNRKKA